MFWLSFQIVFIWIKFVFERTLKLYSFDLIISLDNLINDRINGKYIEQMFD